MRSVKRYLAGFALAGCALLPVPAGAASAPAGLGYEEALAVAEERSERAIDRANAALDTRSRRDDARAGRLLMRASARAVRILDAADRTGADECMLEELDLALGGYEALTAAGGAMVQRRLIRAEREFEYGLDLLDESESTPESCRAGEPEDGIDEEEPLDDLDA